MACFICVSKALLRHTIYDYTTLYYNDTIKLRSTYKVTHYVIPILIDNYYEINNALHLIITIIRN